MQPTSNEPLSAIDSISSRRRSSKNKGEWRDRLSFWIFGLTCKFGFIFMLSAAHDINHNLLTELDLAKPTRHCFELSSGLILVANVVPAHLLLFIIPKVPVFFTLYMTFACLINIASCVLVALADKASTAYMGVVIGSLGYGIADYALSVHCIRYKSSTIDKLTSGINFSGIISSLYYAGLRELKVSMALAFYSLIPLQCLTILVNWFLLRPPKQLTQVVSVPSEDSEFPLSIFQLQPPLKVYEDKCEYIGHLMQYVMPLGVVTVMQFFINQGLYEFVYFRYSFISIDSQYRWLNFIYQVGFFACITTKTLLVLKKIWVYAILQFLVMSYFVLDAVFFFTGYLWATMLLAYFEGIVSGAAYINTKQKMERQELVSRLDEAEVVLKHSLSMNSVLGGTLAALAHYFLCRTAEPRGR